ncbi:MAG: DUF2779 domain-containing protein [Nanoarchaeota archaeon]|nr:DUF2779 domain-containing protein [Nanoarchaeota archaeon]
MLTKSNYLTGLQCLKLLWIIKNDKSRIPDPDKVAEAKFKEGDLIGVLATKVFPNGIDLTNLDFKLNLEKTKEFLSKRKPIFEAGFLIDNLYSRADILLPVEEDKWDIIEVKSGTKIKDINIHDLSFQKYVYEKSGLKIRNCILMHINNEFIKNGEIDPKKFFIQENINKDVDSFSKRIEEMSYESINKRIEEMFKIINGSEPEFNVLDIPSIEYDNICLDEFMKSLSKDNIFELYRMFTKKKIEIYEKGIIKMTDIPEDVKLNEKQQIQRKLAFDGGKHIDKLEIKKFLDNLKYPIYYLDFETINPAIPRFEGTKPYQQIPFQYSLHIQKEKDGEIKHLSFLAEGTEDPRKEFMGSLKNNLGEEGSILVYNQSFEISRFKECSVVFPEFESWVNNNILSRIKDLWDVFKNFYYYDSKQKGSTSIKYVLPVLSDLKYDELEIKGGSIASLEYERVTYGEVDEGERLKILEALEKYCEMDTMAEVVIVKELREIVKDN